jgi:hypothetical protein
MKLYPYYNAEIETDLSKTEILDIVKKKVISKAEVQNNILTDHYFSYTGEIVNEKEFCILNNDMKILGRYSSSIIIYCKLSEEAAKSLIKLSIALPGPDYIFWLFSVLLTLSVLIIGIREDPFGLINILPFLAFLYVYLNVVLKFNDKAENSVKFLTQLFVRKKV